LVVGVGAGGGDFPDAPPGVAVDEGGVGVGDVDVSVFDVSGVGRVVEDAADGEAGPFLSGPVSDAAPVEFVGDSSGAEAFVCVQAHDFAEDGGFGVVRDEFLRFAVDVVAVGAVAAGPFPFRGFGVHAVDHPIDDGFPFEFGEDAE
jgi:hypothetical protein